jgi:Cys-tRNA(Pro) deacylase
MSWPEPVERVSSFLREAAVDARVEECDLPTGTAAEAAEAVGCTTAEIVKTLAFVCDSDTVLALVPGDKRADEGKIARAAGRASARLAKPDEVRAATGFDVGGVSPFPHPAAVRVLVDRHLLGHERVWVAAGSARHVAGLAPHDLVRLARAEAADLVR